MAPQFIHLEPYGREGAHRKNSTERKSSMFDIRDEMVRAPHACGHVASPQPAAVVFGDDPYSVVAQCAEQASRAVDKAGRSLRCDTPVVVVGVASWPRLRTIVDSDPKERKRYELWRDDTVRWLRARWKEALASVVEHFDEPYAHIHFLLVPSIDHNRRLWIGTVHPGRKAERATAESGGSKRDQRKAYEDAMRKMQDDYYESVAARHGLTRIGPGRQRVTRTEWKEQKRQAEALATFYRKARQVAAATTDRRIIALKEQAMDRVTALGARTTELRQQLNQRDTMIANQAEEIQRLADMLLQHGIVNTPVL